MDVKVGDWLIHDLNIVQVKKIDDEGYACVSDGSFETSGQLRDRLRPLTLRNKRLIENFDIYYNRLREIDGEAGFNYPDIHRHFVRLALEAIDGDDDAARAASEQANQFCSDARDYKNPIQGVRLFRPSARRA